MAGLADLHQELAVLRKFQHLIVQVGRGCGRGRFVRRATRRRRSRLAPAVAANPHIAFVIDCNPVVRIRPIVAVARSAPVVKQVARRIELQNRRSRRTTHGHGRIRRGVEFALFERALAMDDPDIILRINGYADRHSDEPMVRQRLRPQRVHFKHRRLHGSRFNSGPLFQQRGSHSERHQEPQEYRSDTQISLHEPVPPSVPVNSIFLGLYFSHLEESICPQIY